MRKTVVFLAILAAYVFGAENTGVIKGKVINASTKEPLPYVNVIVVETGTGAATDLDGNYSITGLAPGTYQVRASAIGFISITKTDINVTNNKPANVDFELIEAAIEIEDVTVTSDYFYRSPTDVNSIKTFGYEEIRRAPGGFEDVVRALSVLPGVGQADPGRNDLIVRGGAPSENLFIVDGIDVPNINHFGTQGATGGPLSYINLDFVRETSFSTGSFPVMYGDKLSSVLRIDLREGRDDHIGGKATVSATQFGLNLEGPISDKSNFIFSARRSYLDLIFKAAGFGFVPEYYDALAKVNYDYDTKNKLSFLFVGAFDNVSYFNDTPEKRYDNSTVLGSDQTQYVTGINYRHLFDHGFVKLSLNRVFTDYDTSQRDSLLQPIFQNKSLEDENRLKGEVVYQFMKTSELHFGGDIKFIESQADIFFPPFATTFGDTLPIHNVNYHENYLKYSAFANWTHVYLRGRLSLNLGGRMDYFDGIDEKYYYSPRFGIKFSLTDLTSVNFGTGIYYQFPSYIWLVATPRNENLKPARVDQFVLGADHRLREDTMLKLEFYLKDYRNYPASLIRPYLVLANTGAGFSGSENNFASFGLEPLASVGTGLAKGVEFSIQKKLSNIPLYGLLSLTYNETEFEALDDVTRPGTYDQTWLFNISGGYKITDNLEASVKFRYATGRPYTPYNPDGSQSVSDYNSERLPDFHSMDVRVDRRWFFDKFTLIAYIDVQNVYNRKNVTAARWDRREQKMELNESSIGILPTIGLSIEF